jgi:hypothetical protein
VASRPPPARFMARPERDAVMVFPTHDCVHMLGCRDVPEILHHQLAAMAAVRRIAAFMLDVVRKDRVLGPMSHVWHRGHTVLKRYPSAADRDVSPFSILSNFCLR